MEEVRLLFESLGAWPYGGLFVFFLVVNTLVPVPEEIFLLGLGYFARADLFNVFFAGAIAVAGLIISDIIIFSLVKAGNKFMLRTGEKLFGDLTKNRDFLNRHIKKIIFFSRFVMAFRFIGPFSAGLLKVRLRTFIFYDLLAIIILVAGLIFLGLYFHDRIEKIISGVQIVKHFAFIGIATMIFLGLVQYLRRKLLRLFLP